MLVWGSYFCHSFKEIEHNVQQMNISFEWFTTVNVGLVLDVIKRWGLLLHLFSFVKQANYSTYIGLSSWQSLTPQQIDHAKSNVSCHLAKHNYETNKIKQSPWGG